MSGLKRELRPYHFNGMIKNETIYLDSHATTRVDQDVLSAMLPYFTEHYGNGNHRAGWKGVEAIENARYQVASLLDVRPSEIIFTAGSTEAINMALLGLAQNDRSGRKHIVTQKSEHKAVLACVKVLENQGYDVTYLDVYEVGRVSLDDVESCVTQQTLVVAIMLANNEIGTLQPVKEIGAICKRTGAKFFCDLTQGLGWNRISLYKMNIDMAAVSAHKIYGPKGAGAFFLRKTNPGT